MSDIFALFSCFLDCFPLLYFYKKKRVNMEEKMAKNVQTGIITQEEMDKIIGILLEKGILTTKDLKNAGISEYRLKKLHKDGVLKRVKIGHYMPMSIDQFFNRALSFISAQERLKDARNILELCNKIEPESIKVNFYLFYLAVMSKDFSSIPNYLDILKNSPDKNEQRDLAFYLYMLSFSMNLPDYYKEIVFKTAPKDFKIEEDDVRFSQPKLASSIRSNAYRQKFNLALRQLNKDRTREQRQSPVNSMTYSLIYSAKHHEKVTTARLLESLDNEDLENSLEILKKEENMHPLKRYHRVVKTLLEDILEMKRTGIPILTTTSPVQIVDELVYHHDYKRALAVNAESAKRRSIDASLTALGRLLEYAEDFRNSLISKEVALQEPVAIEPRRDLLSDMLTLLLTEGTTDKGKDEALSLLKQQMTNIGLEGYYYLIANLILISIEAGDTSFMSPMTTLAALATGEYKIDIYKYIEELEYSIEKGYLKEARMYLTIIEEAFKKGHTDIDVVELATLLGPLQTRLKEKEKLSKDQFTIKPVEDI